MCAYGVIKRYHRTIHEECLAAKSLINLDNARNQIAGFIDYYNTKRLPRLRGLHSSLFYLTPDDFLNDRITEKLEVRIAKLLLAKKVRYEVKNVN